MRDILDLVLFLILGPFILIFTTLFDIAKFCYHILGIHAKLRNDALLKTDLTSMSLKIIEILLREARKESELVDANKFIRKL